MYEKLRELKRQEIIEQVIVSDDRIRDTISKKMGWWLRDWTTELRAKQVLNGEITVEKFLELAHKKAEKTIAKRMEQAKELLDTVGSADDVQDIKISVDWTRSRTWGANPHASVEIKTQGVDGNHWYSYKGTASGCGYDKESTAIAEALNQSMAVLKLLYDAKEKALVGGEENATNNRATLGYGSGYGALPRFEGGVGTNCFASILERLGFTWEHIAWGKSYDVYRATRKETK